MVLVLRNAEGQPALRFLFRLASRKTAVTHARSRQAAFEAEQTKGGKLLEGWSKLTGGRELNAPPRGSHGRRDERRLEEKRCGQARSAGRILPGPRIRFPGVWILLIDSGFEFVNAVAAELNSAVTLTWSPPCCVCEDVVDQRERRSRERERASNFHGKYQTGFRRSTPDLGMLNCCDWTSVHREARLADGADKGSGKSEVPKAATVEARSCLACGVSDRRPSRDRATTASRMNETLGLPEARV
ncbi:hypothetical protein VTK26DRAFT_1225 [Humicola hyalothermophila]